MPAAARDARPAAGPVLSIPFMTVRVRRRLRALFVPAAFLTATLSAGACRRARPVPLSVQLQGVPRIVRVPPELVRDGPLLTSAVVPVAPGLADAFYGITAPQLERWGLDIRLVVEPAYVAAILLRESQYDTLGVRTGAAGGQPAVGLSGFTPAADAELRAAVQTPAFAWMAAEVNAWPRDAALRAEAPQGPATVRGRVRSGALTSQSEYLLGAERSARAAMFRVKVLQTRWTTDALPGGDGSFARRALANGAELTNDQVLDLVTVSYHWGPAWVRRTVERLGPTWVTRLPELGADGVAAAAYLERVRHYTRLLGGDPSVYPTQPTRRPT